MTANHKSLTMIVGRKARAFSLVDLLVSISVMSVLIAILLPTLSSAQEASHRAKCGSNIRQLGLGLQMFSFDRKDLMPQSIFRGDGSSRSSDSQNTIFLRLDPTADRESIDTRDSTATHWDGLGILANLEYADAPNVYYCPSHKGSHPYNRYADTWLQPSGVLAGNYQYRIPAPDTMMFKLPQPTTLIADGMRTQADYSHVKGNNMLKADLSVCWATDTDSAIFSQLAMTETEASRSSRGVDNGWQHLDQSGGENSPSGIQGSTLVTHR